MDQAPDKKRTLITAAVVFAVAFLIRLSYLLSMKGDPLFVRLLGGDSIYYDFIARKIIDGTWVEKTAYLTSPLYRYFVVALYAISHNDLNAVRIVQVLLGSVSAVLVYFIGCRLFGEAVGLMAGILLAFYKLFFFFEGLLLPDSILPFFCLLTVWMCLLAYDRPQARWWIAAGACLGLTALTRPTVLLFLPGAIAWIWLKKQAAAKTRLLACLSFIAGAGLVISPLTVRNYLVDHDFVLITAAGGLNFYIGNNAHTEGSYYLPEGMSFRIGDPYDDYYGRKVAEAAAGNKPLSVKQISDYWMRRGLDFVHQEPGAATRLFLRKLYLLVDAYEIPQLDDFYAYQAHSALLQLPLPTTGLIMPLGLLGLILSFKKGRQAWVLHLFTLAYGLSISLFFILSRYRLPLLPFMTIFSAYSIHWMVEALRQKRAWVLYGTSVALFALMLALNLNPGGNIARAQSYGTPVPLPTATETITRVPTATETETPTVSPSPQPTLLPTNAPVRAYLWVGGAILVVLCLVVPVVVAVVLAIYKFGTRKPADGNIKRS